MAVVASFFGDIASSENLQLTIDNQIQLLYGKSIWRNLLDVGIPQIDLTFTSIIGRSRIEAAASIVDPDAPAPLRGRAAIEKLDGKIPTIKEKFAMNQDDYRKLKALQALPISDTAKLDIMVKAFSDDVTKAAVSPDYRIDIMLLQALSTFTIDVSITNNPDGVAFGIIPLLNLASQKRTVVKAWTDPTADGIKDIDDVVQFAANIGRSFSEIWIDNSKWLQLKNLASTKAYISGLQNPGSNNKYNVDLESVNEYLTKNNNPPLRILNERRGIEVDGVIQVFNPWKVENITFMPAGKVGTLHNAISIDTWEPVPFVTYANYDKAVVSKWRDNDPWKEYTGVELNAFPGLEQIDGIYILQTDVVTA
jgi:hypothetical protein